MFNEDESLLVFVIFQSKEPLAVAKWEKGDLQTSPADTHKKMNYFSLLAVKKWSEEKAPTSLTRSVIGFGPLFFDKTSKQDSGY